MKDNNTTRPYIIRALHEWCSDNGFTPNIAVRVNDQTVVPAAFIKNGEIILNISYDATRHLKIDNEFIQFSARFSGVSHEISVPVSTVFGIFARETGQGMAFDVGHEGPEPKNRNGKEKSRKKPRLQVVR